MNAFHLVIAWIGLAFLAGYIAHNKGRSAVGFFLLSAILSPLIGLLAALLVSSDAAVMASRNADQVDTKACPYCGESVKKVAIKCRFCGSELPAEAPSQVII